MYQGRSCGALALPENLLANVLSCIDQRHRLLSCSAVNHNWNTAAKLVTKTLTCRLPQSPDDRGFCTWLGNNSCTSNIESIEIAILWTPGSLCSDTQPVLQLPFHKLCKLQSLCLRSCRLQPAELPQAANSTAVATAPLVSLSALTALTQLQLYSCMTGFCDLGSCTALQHLDLFCSSTSASGSWGSPGAPADSNPEEAMLAAALPHLQHLTFLAVCKDPDPAASQVQFPAFSSPLSSMQKLQAQRLVLGSYVATSTASLAHLPIGLRSLVLDTIRGPPMTY